MTIPYKKLEKDPERYCCFCDKEGCDCEFYEIERSKCKVVYIKENHMFCIHCGSKGLLMENTIVDYWSGEFVHCICLQCGDGFSLA